jgi:hypothetical protein
MFPYFSSLFFYMYVYKYVHVCSYTHLCIYLKISAVLKLISLNSFCYLFYFESVSLTDFSPSCRSHFPPFSIGINL